MKRWLLLLLNLLSLALFGLIFWWSGPTEIWQQLRAGDPLWLFIACLFHGFVSLISGIRLRVVAESVAGRPLGTWQQFYRLNMIARAWGIVLPRTVSTLGGKAVGLRALNLSLRRSVWSVMVDNLFDVLLLAAVALPALPYLQNQISLTTYFLLYSLTCLFLGLALWWGSQPGRLDFLLRWLRRIPWLAEKLKLTEETAVSLLPPPTITLHRHSKPDLFAQYRSGFECLCCGASRGVNGRSPPLPRHLPHHPTQPHHRRCPWWSGHRRLHLGWPTCAIRPSRQHSHHLRHRPPHLRHPLRPHLGWCQHSAHHQAHKTSQPTQNRVSSR